VSRRLPSGSLVALVTPFRQGAIDWDPFAALIELQIEQGSAALVPCGSTGEAATLSHEEHAQVVRFVVDHARGRVPVIAGTGSNSTAEAIRLTTEAKRAGAAGALLISPYYNRPTQEGIVAHFRAIADAVELPLILYNIPGRTASRLEADTIARLAEHPNIVGLKEADTLDHALDVLQAVGDRLLIYAGDDSITLALVAHGGAGVISTIANAVPREMADLVAATQAGDLARARALHRRLMPLMRACFTETNPIPLKHAMALLGRCGDELRLPLVPMTDPARREALARALRDLGHLR
jgi:4-hydroxy-tetrahydrodipicolinate synthase